MYPSRMAFCRLWFLTLTSCCSSHLYFYFRLGLPGLDLNEKYHRIISHFLKDIESVQNTYMSLKDDPPVVRDLPPMAGKIAWSQQLLHRLQEPMEEFRASSASLLAQAPDLKRVVKKYNKTARVLLEFEVVYHQAWLRQVRRFVKFVLLLLTSYLYCHLWDVLSVIDCLYLDVRSGVMFWSSHHTELSLFFVSSYSLTCRWRLQRLAYRHPSLFSTRRQTSSSLTLTR